MEETVSLPAKNTHTAEKSPWSLHKEDVKNSLEKSNQRQGNTSYQTGRGLLKKRYSGSSHCYSKCSTLRRHKKASNLYWETAIHLHYVLPPVLIGHLRHSNYGETTWLGAIMENTLLWENQRTCLTWYEDSSHSRCDLLLTAMTPRFPDSIAFEAQVSGLSMAIKSHNNVIIGF